MTNDLDRLTTVRDAAREARARLAQQAGATRDRLLPSRLTADARLAAEQRMRTAVADTADHIRSNKVETAVTVGAVIAWIFRKPLLRVAPPAARSAYNWLAGRLAVVLPAHPADEHAGDEISGDHAGGGEDDAAENRGNVQ